MEAVIFEPVAEVRDAPDDQPRYRPGAVPWLIIRGISDFGDGLKDDRFHAFASCAAAAVLYDFIAHGLHLDTSPLPAVSSEASIDPSSVGRRLRGSSSVRQLSRRPV